MNEAQNPKMEKELIKYLLITAGIGIVLLAIYFGWFNYSHSPLSKDSSDWGSLGDFLNGFISPVLSGIMIMAVIRTITLQRQMINEQRTQITHSNNLMRVSTAIQGITSMMNHHESLRKGYQDNIDSIKPAVNDTELDKYLEENYELLNYQQKIIFQCADAIQRLMLSTSESSEKDILYAGKLIDEAISKHPFY